MHYIFIAISALFILFNMYFLLTDITWYYLLLIPLWVLITYRYIRDRIDIHYMFKIFAVLMGVASLLIPLQVLFGWTIINISSTNLLIADSMALATILLLRTHGWLKVPVTFSILSGMFLLPYGIWGIIISILVYTVLSHTTTKGRLLNLVKVCGFAAASLIIISLILYKQLITILTGDFDILHFSIESLYLIPIHGIYGIILNFAFYILIIAAIYKHAFFAFNLLKTISQSNPLDEIEHNNVLMILAILMIFTIYLIPSAKSVLLQPVFWLSMGLLYGRYRYLMR